MGSWGTGISSNDTFADVHAEFFDLYNDGLEVGEISEKLIKENQETIDDVDDSNNFWFALAKAQWECKQLDRKLFEKVRNIIESDSDLKVWRELGADEKDIKSRKIVLEKFLAKLETEKPKARARKKKIVRQPVFAKGDCLAFKLENGNYSGAVVLEAIYDTEYGYNLIVSTRINKPTKPNKEDFEKAEVLFLNFANWNDEPNFHWFLPLRFKKIQHLFEKVTNIEVKKKYNIENSMISFCGDFDIYLIEQANRQFESEKTRQTSSAKQLIKENI
jgi:hypothetical protein